MELSIIIPVFNGARYLRECLASLPADAEIIVVDDESGDGCDEIARSLGAAVFSIPHGGPVRARNFGLRQAGRKFVMFMDADDILVRSMPLGFDGDVVMAMRRNFPGEHEPQFGAIAGCAVFHRAAFDKFGFFDEDLLCGDGYEWLLRGAKITRLPFVACMRRIHGGNMGMTMRKREMSDYAKIIRKHFS